MAPVAGLPIRTVRHRYCHDSALAKQEQIAKIPESEAGGVKSNRPRVHLSKAMWEVSLNHETAFAVEAGCGVCVCGQGIRRRRQVEGTERHR